VLHFLGNGFVTGRGCRVIPESPRLRPLPVLVGLFALWQLGSLVAGNLIDFVPRRPGLGDDPPLDLLQERGEFTHVEPLQRSAELVGDVLDGWGELTGQKQGWSLFAPGLPPHTLLPAAEFRFPDGTSDTVLSRFEPADLANPPARAPLIHDREFNFEFQLVVPAWFASDEVLTETPQAGAHLTAAVRDRHRPILAWLRWQLRRYQEAHPERGTPSEVILMLRYIPTPRPGQPRDLTKLITQRPFARWKPGTEMIEAFDPATRRFVLLPVGGTP
jgi:hypothetical protein